VCSEAGPSRRWKQVGESSVLNDHRIHIYIYSTIIYIYISIHRYIYMYSCLFAWTFQWIIIFPCQIRQFPLSTC
jgi:hypothetical protein